MTSKKQGKKSQKLSPSEKEKKYPNLSSSGHFKNVPGAAAKAGKLSRPYSKYKSKVLRALGYKLKGDWEEATELMTLPKHEFDEIIKMLLVCDFSKILALAKKDDIPSVLRVYARGLEKDAARGETKNIKEIMDRVFGKPDQKIDTVLSGGVANLHIEADMTPQEASKIYMDALNPKKET